MSKDLRRKRVKKRKILKKIGLAVLAGFMFCLPVLGAACTPLLALPENETPPILALDPETDPTVYTTQSGLEIKKSNAYISSTISTKSNTGKTYTQDLSGFYYFTMGKFSGTIYTGASRTSTYSVTNETVNWLIIGRGEFDFYDDTPAGSDIQNDVNDQEIALQGCYLPMSMSTIPQNEEIPKNSFLVLSEKLLGQMYFNCAGAVNAEFYTQWDQSYFVNGSGGILGNRYRYKGNTNTGNNKSGQTWTIAGNPGGSLYNYINSLFSKNHSTGEIVGNSLGFTQDEANMIIPQQLYTFYSDGPNELYLETPETDGGTYYSMFPLACKEVAPTTKQSFCLEDYLANATQRTAILIKSSTNQSYSWLTRSGNYQTTRYAMNIYLDGTIGYGGGVHTNDGVRPAMVVKLQ